ncbi:MAG: hypothetical protein BWY83_01548 [bacterium ADurb.Bin478]|nr:MAG: hypothetical protein BWY83_01548 [bacterium ADurb.Bin478]
MCWTGSIFLRKNWQICFWIFSLKSILQRADRFGRADRSLHGLLQGGCVFSVTSDAFQRHRTAISRFSSTDYHDVIRYDSSASNFKVQQDVWYAICMKDFDKIIRYQTIRKEPSLDRSLPSVVRSSKISSCRCSLTNVFKLAFCLLEWTGTAGSVVPVPAGAAGQANRSTRTLRTE